jgi:cytochrome c oxidase assembly protein subunit 15
VAHRLALLTLAATFVLILAGGLVTNTGAGLAVPDWPNTFGYNMLLFPWARMVGGIFYEHSHRLLGAAVGLLTLALGAALWGAGGRLRALGVVAVLAVVAQGVLGGLRVVLLEDALAIVHGSLAQAFFALLSAVALLTSPAAGVAARPVAPGTRALALAAAAAVYVQIVFGALLTHAGWLWLHLGGAVAVFAVVPVLTARLRRSGDPVAAPVARALLALLGLQLLLGAGSFLARFSSVWIPGGQTTMLVLPVAHRLAGSLILGATVVLALRVWIANGAAARVDRADRSHHASLSGHPRHAPASRTPLK